MSNNIKEILFVLGIILLAVFLLNPWDFWMPSMVHITALVILVVIFGGFAAFVWNEERGDERDKMHQMFAGRAGFLVAAGVAVLGIVVQSWTVHIVDPWLVATLTLMTVTKIISRRIARDKY